MRVLKIISIFVFLAGLTLLILGALYNPSSTNLILANGQIKDYEFDMHANETTKFQISGTDYFTIYIMNSSSVRNLTNFSGALYTATGKNINIEFTAPQAGKYHLIIANVNSNGFVSVSIVYGPSNNIPYLIAGILVSITAIILPVIDYFIGRRKREKINTKCPECGRPVSSSWNYCPYCRHPLKENEQVIKFVVPLIIMILIISSVPVTKADTNNLNGKGYHLKWEFDKNPNTENKTYYYLNLTVEDVAKVNGSVSNNRSINLTVPQKEYEFYHEYPGGYRFSTDGTYLKYFLTTYDNATQMLARELDNISSAKGFDRLTELNFILSFVQTLNYYDDITKDGFIDYYKFPLETLVDEGGDCEDKSVLMATIAHILGYDVVLFVMNVTTVLTNEKAGHVAVGVHISPEGWYGQYLQDYYTYNGKAYYYMETTASESQKLGGGTIHYYVGISPEETDYYEISDLKFVTFSTYVYHGYSGNSQWVKSTSQTFKSNSSLYMIPAIIFPIVYVPIIIATYKSERKKCPSCGHEIENDYVYCPYCGYPLKLQFPPPPPIQEF